MSQIECLICHSRTDEGVSSELGKLGHKKLVQILKEMSTLEFDFDEFAETTCKKKEDKICTGCERQLYEFDGLMSKLGALQKAIDELKNDIKAKSLQSQISRKNKNKDLRLELEPEQGEIVEEEYYNDSFPPNDDYDDLISFEPSPAAAAVGVSEQKYEVEANHSENFNNNTASNDVVFEEIDLKCQVLVTFPFQELLPESRVILLPLQLPNDRAGFTVNEKIIKDYIRQEESKMRKRRREKRRRKVTKEFEKLDQQNNKLKPPEQKVYTGPIQMPPYVVNMICVLEAITILNEANGSSLQEIMKYLTNSKVYNFDGDKMDCIQVAVQNLMKNGKLEEIKSDGVAVKGTFKLSSTAFMKKPPEKKLYKFKLKTNPCPRNNLLNNCPICQIKFIKKSNYQWHMSEHTGEAPFKCELCSTTGHKCQRALDYHLTTHGIGQVYNQCYKCPKVKYFSHKFDYDKHMKLHVKKELQASECDNYFCELCASTFDNEKLFNVHKRKEHVTHKCTFENCDKVYRTIGGLSHHISAFHEKKTVLCPICHEEFSNMKSKMRHMKFIHEKNKKQEDIMCEICNKICPGLYFYRRHKSTVHFKDKIRPYPCSYCERKFSDASNRLRHERIHRGEYRFSCTICSKKFIVRGSARLHIAKIHPEISGEGEVAKYIGVLNKNQSV